MQTLPWESVLSQMTEAHAGFLMMKRSVCVCISYATIVSEKIVQKQIVVESSNSSTTVCGCSFDVRAEDKSVILRN